VFDNTCHVDTIDSERFSTGNMLVGVLQEQTLQFLGTKAAVGIDPANPYKVAPVSVRACLNPTLSA